MDVSPFTRWSRWFEEALTDYHKEYPDRAFDWKTFQSLKPDILAVMAWIISSADSSGTGFGLDAYSEKSVADEIGSTPENVRRCFETLARVGLIDSLVDHPGRPILRACLSSAGGPRDETRCAHLIASLPWNRSND